MTGLYHVPCRYLNPLQGLEVTPLDGMRPLDGIRCQYCHSLMDDCNGENLWKIPVARYLATHRRVMSSMRKVGIELPERRARIKRSPSERDALLQVCPVCGWWVAIDRAIFCAEHRQIWTITLVSGAVLRDLDVQDINVPIMAVRRYLSAKQQALRDMHPRLFEETVASVFRDFDYRADVTAYSSDGGIDVVLRSSAGDVIGVQVKRKKRSIEVEQIRSFLGALTLGGYRRGVFVATSKFQKGSVEAARISTSRHIPIELVDGDRFLHFLGAANMKVPATVDDCGIQPGQDLRFTLHSHLNLNSL
ncbi:MAG: restriction endonuclease [Stenotrophomonas sp.]